MNVKCSGLLFMRVYCLFEICICFADITHSAGNNNAPAGENENTQHQHCCSSDIIKVIYHVSAQDDNSLMRVETRPELFMLLSPMSWN